MNTLIIIGLMAFAAMLGAIGQIVMKRASGAGGLVQLIPYAIAFIILYGIGVVISFFVYKSGAKISVAYPIIALSYAFAAVFAWKLLGESMNGWIISGIVIIIVGVACIGVGAA